MTSSAFDRLDQPVESALHDADPDGYRPPEWVSPPPWHLTRDGL